MTKHRYLARSLACLVLSLGSLAAAGSTAAAAEPLPDDVRSFLQTRCVGCHGDKKAKGKLNLEALMKPVCA